MSVVRDARTGGGGLGQGAALHRGACTFTDGRIYLVGGRTKRRDGKRADYILRFRRDFPIAVVEAKAEDALPGDGLQQAKDYAENGVSVPLAAYEKTVVEQARLLPKAKSKVGEWPRVDSAYALGLDWEGSAEKEAKE